MSSGRWYAVDVLVEPAAVEAVESAFNELGSSGTEVAWLKKNEDEPRRVTGFFDASPELSEVRQTIEIMLSAYGFDISTISPIEARTVEEQDWLAEWKKHWRPTHIGRFVITPPWIEVSEPEKLVIRIEPKMAFGTGTHETTQLCLQAIDETYTPEQTFLDIGTGTGVLAIAAAKMGGTEILGCDTDPESITAARENARLNGVASAIDLHEGPLTDEILAHDFVCANVTLDVIVPILDLLLTKTKRTLVLSGILTSQQQEIVDNLADRGTQPLINRKGEWICLVLSPDRAS